MLRISKTNTAKACKLAVYLAGLAALGACTTTGTSAGLATGTPSRAAFMVLGEVAPAPIAYLDFCTRRPAECAAPAPALQPPIAPAPVAPAWSAVAAADAAQDASASVAPIMATGSVRATGLLHWSGGPQLALTLTPEPSVAASQPLLPIAALAADEVGRGTVAVLDGWSTAAAQLPPAWAEEPPTPAPPPVEVAEVVVTSDPVRASDGRLRRTPQLMARLDAVNRRVNAAIKATPDSKIFGRADHWDLPLAEGMTTGDCEDYVLEKRRALVAEGVPADALSIAVAVTRWGEHHALLVVTTDQGDFVLDSFSQRVAPWNELSYRWIQRQVAGAPLQWVSIVG